MAFLNNYVQSIANFENLVFSGMAKVRSQHVHIDVFHFLWRIFMIYQYLGRKLVCLCWLLNKFVSKLLFQPKINFCWKYPKTLISHNLRTSHQNLKKKLGIYIDHKRNKICKNEGFLKKSLFHTAWFLQKMALKVLTRRLFKSQSNILDGAFCENS